MLGRQLPPLLLPQRRQRVHNRATAAAAAAVCAAAMANACSGCLRRGLSRRHAVCIGDAELDRRAGVALSKLELVVKLRTDGCVTFHQA
eukprot:365388-Chlamydomonas_euryale.AAC.9